MRKQITAICLALVAMTAGSSMSVAAESLYACGKFNDWDINKCLEFNESEGMYFLEIDFSEGTGFKISTCEPTGNDVGECWNNFDKGAMELATGSAQLNTYAPLVPGQNNINAPAQKPLTVIVDIDAMRICFSDGGSISHPYSETLPVLYINTNDREPVTSRDTYLKATYYLDPMGIEGVEAIGSADAPLTMQIKGRGNWTWIGFDKKPYRLKLDDKQPLMGMKKNKHFALMANADDTRGFMRNAVGFEISKLIGMPWTPNQHPVELMLNGEYLGLYFLSEVIKVDKDRVNITEQKDNLTTMPEITGGWLVEIDNYDTDPHVTVIEGGDNHNYPIWFTYKSPEELSAEQETYLTDQMSNLNDLIYGDTNSSKLWEYLDMDQLARFYITQEITDNYESFHGSCYLYRNRGEDCKWQFGPVWDFGSAFNYRKSQFIYEGREHHQVWIKQICQFPAFNEKVQELWKAFDIEQYDKLYTFITDLSNRLAVAAVFDGRRWPQYSNAAEIERADYVKDLLAGTRTWLQKQWGKQDGVSEVATDAAEGPYRYYNMQGQLVMNPRAGIYIRVAANGTATKVAIKNR